MGFHIGGLNVGGGLYICNIRLEYAVKYGTKCSGTTYSGVPYC